MGKARRVLLLVTAVDRGEETRGLTIIICAALTSSDSQAARAPRRQRIQGGAYNSASRREDSTPHRCLPEVAFHSPTQGRKRLPVKMYLTDTLPFANAFSPKYFQRILIIGRKLFSSATGIISLNRLLPRHQDKFQER